MRKNFGPKTWLYPMPVLIIGTYDENGIPNAMNAAWDGICVGEIVNVCADENVLDKNGRVDAKKLDPIIYDSVTHAYWNLGEKIGQAFSDGKKLK